MFATSDRRAGQNLQHDLSEQQHNLSRLIEALLNAFLKRTDDRQVELQNHWKDLVDAFCRSNLERSSSNNRRDWQEDVFGEVIDANRESDRGQERAQGGGNNHNATDDGTMPFALWAMQNLPRRLVLDCVTAEFGTAAQGWRLPRAKNELRRVATIIIRKWKAPIYENHSSRQKAGVRWDKAQKEQENHVAVDTEKLRELYSESGVDADSDDYKMKIIALFFGVNPIWKPAFWKSVAALELDEKNFVDYYMRILAQALRRQGGGSQNGETVQAQLKDPTTRACCLRPGSQTLIPHLTIEPADGALLQSAPKSASYPSDGAWHSRSGKSATTTSSPPQIPDDQNSPNGKRAASVILGADWIGESDHDDQNSMRHLHSDSELDSPEGNNSVGDIIHVASSSPNPEMSPRAATSTDLDGSRLSDQKRPNIAHHPVVEGTVSIEADEDAHSLAPSHRTASFASSPMRARLDNHGKGEDDSASSRSSSTSKSSPVTLETSPMSLATQDQPVISKELSLHPKNRPSPAETDSGTRPSKIRRVIDLTQESAALGTSIQTNELRTRPHFRQEDLERFSVDRCLNDELVNGVMEHLVACNPHMSTISSGAWVLTAQSRRTLPCELSTVFVLPVNLEDKHWVCLVVHVREREARLFDSLCTNMDKLDRTCLELARLFVSNWLPGPFNNWEERWHTVQPEQCPQQENSVDCGIYCLAVSMHITLGLEVPSSIDSRFLRSFFRAICTNINYLATAPTATASARGDEQHNRVGISAGNPTTKTSLQLLNALPPGCAPLYHNKVAGLPLGDISAPATNFSAVSTLEDVALCQKTLEKYLEKQLEAVNSYIDTRISELKPLQAAAQSLVTLELALDAAAASRNQQSAVFLDGLERAEAAIAAIREVTKDLGVIGMEDDINSRIGLGPPSIASLRRREKSSLEASARLQWAVKGVRVAAVVQRLESIQRKYLEHHTRHHGCSIAAETSEGD